jgi:Protein of unknown function (DUF2510)
MTTPPPGWYDDRRGARRWWDGANWTDHVTAASVDQPAPEFTAPSTPPPAAEPAPAPTGIASPYAPDPIPQAGVAPPYVADGYASAAYPGAFDSAPPATAEAPKPRSWIVWVVIGAVVVAVAIVLAVLSPMLWSAFTAGSSPSGMASPSATPVTTESSSSSEEPPPSAADEQAAVEVVQRHNEAWLAGDCDGFMATTTEDLREFMEIPDCESFAVEARSFAGGVDDYVTTISDVEALASAVAVSTIETYTSLFDAEGNQTDEVLEYEDRYEYIVVRSDGGWAIDDFFLE